MRNLIKIISECEALKKAVGCKEYNNLLNIWTNDFRTKYDNIRYKKGNEAYMKAQIIYLQRKVELELRKYEK